MFSYLVIIKSMTHIDTSSVDYKREIHGSLLTTYSLPSPVHLPSRHDVFSKVGTVVGKYPTRWNVGSSYKFENPYYSQKMLKFPTVGSESTFQTLRCERNISSSQVTIGLFIDWGYFLVPWSGDHFGQCLCED